MVENEPQCNLERKASMNGSRPSGVQVMLQGEPTADLTKALPSATLER